MPRLVRGTARKADGVRYGEMGLLDSVEQLAINGKGGELDGEEPIATRMGNHDTKWLAGHGNDDGLVGLGPV